MTYPARRTSSEGSESGYGGDIGGGDEAREFEGVDAFGLIRDRGERRLKSRVARTDLRVCNGLWLHVSHIPRGELRARLTESHKL